MTIRFRSVRLIGIVPSTFTIPLDDGSLSGRPGTSV